EFGHWYTPYGIGKNMPVRSRLRRSIVIIYDNVPITQGRPRPERIQAAESARTSRGILLTSRSLSIEKRAAPAKEEVLVSCVAYGKPINGPVPPLRFHSPLLQVVESQIQFQYIHSRFSQNSKRPDFDVMRDQLAYAFRINPAGFRHASC